MTTENLPAVQSQTAVSIGMPTPQEFQMLQVIAKNAQDSGLYAGVGQQSKIFMVLLAARELGVSPMLALNGGIWNISGKIEISARLMNGLIRRAGHSIKIIISNDEICTLLGVRGDNGDKFECSFSMADASKAGLSGGNVWKKYPADMLYNRCMSRLARRLFSDVIGNCYVEGEIREAKEVEAKEKHLPFAECEQYSPPKIDHFENKIIDANPIQGQSDEPKLSFDQISEIMKGLAQTDDVFQENYSKFMQEKWFAKEYEDLPLKSFAPTMTAIQRNIELNKQKKAI